jgi:hypothetical protein
MNHGEPTNELRKWCEGKPIGFAIIATEIATAVEKCYQLLDMCRSGDGFWGKLKTLSLSEKSEFYQSSWNVARAVLIELGVLESEADESILWLQKLFIHSEDALADIRREIAAIPEAEVLAVLNELRKAAGPMLEDHLRELDEDHLADKLDAKTRAAIGELLDGPGVRFVILIAFPCWILTGQLPDRVIESNVRSGRPNKKLRELIRIDPFVMHLPEIQEVLHPECRRLRQSRHSWLATTAKGSVHRVKRTNLRYRLGRLVMDMAERLHVDLKWPEVESLFKAGAALDCGPIDHREPIEPASFRELSNKYRSHWELSVKPDKKSRKTIDALRRALS